MTKSEEHADSNIRSGPAGKSFRLRSDGIVIKGLATTKFLLKQDNSFKKEPESVKCQQLSITESAFWTLGEPYVFTNMRFMHLQNVPMEQRYVLAGNLKQTSLTFFNFRNFVPNLPNYQCVTRKKILITDYCDHRENMDRLTSFSLRPPELLCISNPGVYVRLFVVKKCTNGLSELMKIYKSTESKPWIHCLGKQVKIHPFGLLELRDFLIHYQININEDDVVRRQIILDMLHSDPNPLFVDFDCSDSILPEVVFRKVSPRDSLNFLVSFLLSFGFYHTQLDLYETNNLFDSFVRAKVIDSSVEDNKDLVVKYILEDLRFQPGGVLIFSSKMLSAGTAFNQLLGIESSDNFEMPDVLLDQIQFKLTREVEDFLQFCNASMWSRVRQLDIPNIPDDPTSFSELWQPLFQRAQLQSVESFNEQQKIPHKIFLQLQRLMAGERKLKNQMILGMLTF